MGWKTNHGEQEHLPDGSIYWSNRVKQTESEKLEEQKEV